IPNPEAKPLIADNTAPFRCGNVGRCLVRSILLSLFYQSLLLFNFIIHLLLYKSSIFIFIDFIAWILNRVQDDGGVLLG
ncbi:MAG: hypothetical protein RBR54_11175, partial [Sulfurimonas sp.]|nr:hypothetical protein [Sulfurimonas sp.]